MQSSAAMQQSCIREPRQLFLSSEQGGGGGRGEGGREEQALGGGGDENCNSVLCSNAAKLYLWTKAIVSFQ